MAFNPDDPNFFYQTEEEALQVTPTLYAVVGMWWVSHPTKGIIWYRNLEGVYVAQCHVNENMVKGVCSYMFGDWAVPKFMPTVYVPTDFADVKIPS